MEEKEPQISYRHLESVTGRSMPQLRRYALTFHGINSEADRQGGVSREFSLTDGFAVYLMGVLVNDYGLTLAEAKTHVWQILWNVGRVGPKADLTELGYLRPIVGWKHGFSVAGVMLRIYPGPHPAYEFRVFKDAPEVATNDQKFTQETVARFKSYWLPSAAMSNQGVGGTLGKIYEIPLSAHLKLYFASLRKLGF